MNKAQRKNLLNVIKQKKVEREFLSLYRKWKEEGHKFNDWDYDYLWYVAKLIVG